MDNPKLHFIYIIFAYNYIYIFKIKYPHLTPFTKHWHGISEESNKQLATEIQGEKEIVK